MHEDPVFAREWLMRKIGERNFDFLTLRKNLKANIDYKLLEIILKQRIAL